MSLVYLATLKMTIMEIVKVSFGGFEVGLIKLFCCSSQVSLLSFRFFVVKLKFYLVKYQTTLAELKIIIYIK